MLQAPTPRKLTKPSAPAAVVSAPSNRLANAARTGLLLSGKAPFALKPAAAKAPAPIASGLSLVGKAPISLKLAATAKAAEPRVNRGLRPLLEYSAGLVPPAHYAGEASQYTGDSLLPIYPMIPYGNSNSLKITSDVNYAKAQLGDLVSVLSFRELREKFRPHMLAHSTREKMRLFNGKPEREELIQDMLELIKRDFTFTREVCTYHGILYNDKGLPGSTVDTTINKLIGLHIDSWDKGKVEQRRTARTRICINLSEEPRRLLFMKDPIAKILKRCEELGYNPRREAFPSPRDVVKFYVTHAKDEAVVYGLNVAPWCAYFVPTENLVHDGSTYGRTTADLSFAILGDFRPKPHFRPEYIVIEEDA